jgi:hypothetical protein
MADGVWTFELCDQNDVLLADVTGLVTATISPRLNQPFSMLLDGAADQEEWKTIHGDGFRYLTEGMRTIKAKRNGVLIANPEIWRVDYTGDEDSQTVEVSCFDSMVRLPMRAVSDNVGRDDAQVFPDSITAGAFVLALFQNSILHDDDVPYGTTRPFPIDPSGAFTAATDVSDLLGTAGNMAGLIYTKICDTGVADVMLTPTDTAAGSAPGIYGKVHCVDAWGSDKTGTVHFAYDPAVPGSTIKAIRRSFDMATVDNWLRYLFGPKIARDRWRGSLEAVDPALLAVTTSYRDNEAASRARYGTLRSFEVFDSDANTVRELYRALWKAESTLRVNPRQLLYITPAGNSPFEPFADYIVGDRISASLGDDIGPSLTAGIQRIYGMDVTVDLDGVEEPGELIVSPDGASA